MATSRNTQSTVTDLDTQTSADAAAEVAEKAVSGASAKELKGTNADDQLSGKKVTLTIHSDRGDGGTDAVQVGLNGFMYLIPRNKPCLVPAEVAGVIRDAVTTQLSIGEGGKQIEQTLPRYAYQITA